MSVKPQTATFNAEVRENAGKGAARALRREGKVPAVLYGKGHKPLSLALNLNDVTLQYKKGRFRTRIFELNMGKEVVRALPHDLQFHPVTDVLEHVDFIKVTAGSRVRVQVPVKFIGMEKSAGIKRGGVLNVVRHEIEFECNPEKIPGAIEIDVQNMDIGSSVHIGDLKLPEDAKPTIKRNFTIATVAGRKAEEEVAPVAAAATDAATAPAAGAAAPAAGAAAAPAADAKAAAPKKDEKK